MKMDFRTKEFERDELLAIIASNLELSRTEKERMRQAYGAVLKVLEADDAYFDGIDIDMYAQGSLGIGTTIKPFNSKDFDLDVVLHIKDSYKNYSASFIYNELYRVLANDGTYKGMLENKNRCIRLLYTDGFHMDVLPGCVLKSNSTKLAIPEKGLRSYTFTNPLGYIEWFKSCSRAALGKVFLLEKGYQQVLLKAEIDQKPIPDEHVYLKTPLQRAVQIIKRHRDVYYATRASSTFPVVSSIVLTTLIAKSYEGELSIQEAITAVINKFNQLAQDYKVNKKRFKVYNPVDTNPDSNEREDFTDSWTETHYDSFCMFATHLSQVWKAFLHESSEKTYKDLVGDGYYKENVQRQIMFGEQLEGSNVLASLKSGTAFTSATGVINSSREGRRNEGHGFFAE